MNTKATAPEKLDAVRWSIVLLLIIGGMVGFYYFDEQWIWVRILGLLAAVGVASFIAAKTEKGRGTLVFMREAHTEVRKVVWPTPQETLQVTGIVIVMVILVAVFIWILDSILMWIVRLLTTGGG
jgi:preprotein translocase subunit SecE